jgi:hypothetical protein
MLVKTYIDNYGYMRFKDSHISVARWVATKKIHRRLRKEEVVHHIDGNPLNNNPSNLQICKKQIEHDKIHIENAKNRGYELRFSGRVSIYTKIIHSSKNPNTLSPI